MFGDTVKNGQPQDLARLAAELANLTKEYSELKKAFDAFFDVVAPELGYKAATFRFYVGGGTTIDLMQSPRQLAMTAPVPELIRTKKVSK